MSAVMVEEPLATSWAEARQLGLKRYFTGEPCIYGHVAERKVVSRTCFECFRLAAAKCKANRRAVQRLTPEYAAKLEAREAKLAESRAASEQRALLALLRQQWKQERALVKREQELEKQKQREAQHPRVDWVERALRFDAQDENRRLREEARAQGLRKYVSKQPCLRGHIGLRRVMNNQCCECHYLSGRGLLMPKTEKQVYNLFDDGFTPDPPYWADDGGAKRVPIYDHNFGQSRLVRRVGWVNCLGSLPTHRIFSYDVARERICTSCKSMKVRNGSD
jgi:hypothetical protein